MDRTVGLYGDGVIGCDTVDDIVKYFTDKGLKVTDVSGDMDHGWEMNVTGEPRKLFFAVCYKIPGYNSNSVQDFIDEYSIDDIDENVHVKSVVNKILEGVDVRSALVESFKLSELVNKLNALADAALDSGYDQSFDATDFRMNITADERQNCIYVECHVSVVFDVSDGSDDYYNTYSSDFVTGPFYALLNLSKDFLPAGRYYCGENDVNPDDSFKTYGKVKWDANLKSLLIHGKVGVVGVIKLDI